MVFPSLFGKQGFTLKQAIVVRTDLKMGKGKICSQVAHASLQAYIVSKKHKPKETEEWLKEGAKKVVLKVSSERELIEIYERAKRSGLSVVLIRDAGKTQIEPGSITAVGIGPDKEEIINSITGHLKLL